MRKGQDRKVKIVGRGLAAASVGRAGCLGLLALMLAMVNPVGLSAFAEEVEESDEVGAEVVGGKESDAGVVDGEVELYADTPSTVTIAFLPTAATGTVTPLDTSNGDKAKVDVKATVRVQNSGGYKVYVGSASSQLKSGSNAIDSVTAATAYADLPINRWGYSFQEGSTVKDSYVAMPATLRSSALYSNTSTNITDETKTFMLSFAARIGSDKPSGTYSNSVTMSVVSSPLSVAEEVAYDFGGITDMQAMTTAICNAAPTGGVKQLKDTRDDKYYWIGKMKDGKCWMTQNLDLDLNASTTPLTPATSDVTTNWTPGDAGKNPAYTETEVTETTIYNDDTGQRSWSLGDYSIMNPTDYKTYCDSKLESAAACSGSGTKDRLRYYVTPTTANSDANAHYILGNHYQWNAATAGTGGTTRSGQASGSICPKGWKLPESNTEAAGSFKSLIDAYSISSNAAGAAKLVSAPLYFVRGGEIEQGVNFLFSKAGREGDYWSSTRSSNDLFNYYRSYSLSFIAYVNPSDDLLRRMGYSVRCIAK